MSPGFQNGTVIVGTHYFSSLGIAPMLARFMNWAEAIIADVVVNREIVGEREAP